MARVRAKVPWKVGLAKAERSRLSLAGSKPVTLPEMVAIGHAYGRPGMKLLARPAVDVEESETRETVKTELRVRPEEMSRSPLMFHWSKPLPRVPRASRS